MTGLLATLACVGTAHGQSNDALLNKLVDKGIITAKEAEEMKHDSDNKKIVTTGLGMPDWITGVKIYGDVRGRYEFFKTENDFAGAGEPNKDRTRYRYRLRVGATMSMKDNFEVGFRLTSSDPNADGTGGDPISGNTTLQNNGSKKFVYIDTAYGKWTPINSGPWLVSATIGKMDNPFVLSDMVFDHDYTPEGAAIQASYKINDSHALKLIGGFFALDEINQNSSTKRNRSSASYDPYFYGLQLRYDAKWSKELSTSVGVSWMTLANVENLDSASVPNIQSGNTRYATAAGNHIAGDLVNQYNPFIIDMSATYALAKFPLYPGAFPIKVGGEFMHNSGASRNNLGYWGGISFGKAAKKHSWEASYRYKVLEEDAWYEEFTDSDFGAYRQVPFVGDGTNRGYRAGTGVQGHVSKLAYALSDGVMISATWFYAESTNPGKLPSGKETESGEHRLQVDATWKF